MAHSAQKYTLLSTEGAFVCKLDPSEAESLLSQGRVRKINRHKFRLIEHARPSTSADSQCSLTVADTKALAGLVKMSSGRREKLEGWGLLAAEKVQPEAPLRSAARASYFAFVPAPQTALPTA